MELFNIIIFPGFFFLVFLGLFYEFTDRKVHARLQNRVGPPWFQPVADILKLFGKEEIIPEEADSVMFALMPAIALASVVTAYFYIPTWGYESLYPFKCDVIVVIYLLTIPTITFFLAGFFSTSLYSMIGAIRCQTQFFSYEVPMFLAILSPALLADTWSLSEMTKFYSHHPFHWIINIAGFLIAVVCLLGKLEKVPFDMPEAETEIVAGTFTEYSGKFLAFFRLAIDIEMVVGASLIAAVFLPFGLGLNPVFGFILYIVKISFVIFLLTLARTVTARIRIDQMIRFCWLYLAPLAFLQLLISLVAKGILN